MFGCSLNCLTVYKNRQMTAHFLKTNVNIYVISIVTQFYPYNVPYPLVVKRITINMINVCTYLVKLLFTSIGDFSSLFSINVLINEEFV